MSREVIVIRHAKSIGGRHDRHLYPKEGAPLSEQGIIDAQNLKLELEKSGINLNQTVAISKLIRTKQTAENAGFNSMKVYDLLNEVDSGLSPSKLDELVSRQEVPEQAIIAAKKLLDKPPMENIWVTHGMLIAGIGHVLQIPTTNLYIPEMASFTRITIN